MGNSASENTCREKPRIKRILSRIYHKLQLEKNEHFKIPVYKNTPPKVPYHKHMNFYELTIVFSGSAVEEYQEKQTLLQPGNILIYAPEACHRFAHLNHFRNYDILFDEIFFQKCKPFFQNIPGGQSFFPEKGKRSAVFMLSENDLAAVIGMFDVLFEEYAMQRPGWEDAASVEFIRTVHYILRHMKAAEDKSANPNAFKIGRIIHYMENNIGKDLSVTELARSNGMSVSGFRQLFKSVTACSPVKYLMRMKMKRALLMLPVRSRVDDLAKQCGFSDYNYFCRQFRKHFGMSPLTARKKLISRESHLHDMLPVLMSRDV